MESNYIERIGIRAKYLAIEDEEDDLRVISGIATEIKRPKEDTAFFYKQPKGNELLPYNSSECLTRKKIKKKRNSIFSSAITTLAVENQPTDFKDNHIHFTEIVPRMHVHDMHFFITDINSMYPSV